MSERISVLEIADEHVVLDPRCFEAVDEMKDVVVASTARPIGEGKAARLRRFVRDGGGLVVLGPTLRAWSSSGAIREMAGWTPGEPGPETELIVRPDPEHPVTQRLDAEWKVRDRLQLSEGPPAGAAILLRASWRFTEQVVAYERPYGKGRFVHIGLRDDGSPTFAKLLGRAIVFAAGRVPAPPAGVGLLGYGAIGREHAASIAATTGLSLAAVCDLSAERRDAAAREWSVRTHATQQALLEDPDVAVVVVGTPPSAHTEPVLAALAAGKHVVCEKPFSLRVADADRMMDAARAGGRVLTVFQSRRWDPDFVAMRDAIRSGRIGEAFYMESFIGGYGHPCDFWHSHEPISGGMIFDWGSHYFDWMLELFPERVKMVAARAHKLVWHDVTNADQVRVDLTFDGGAQATFLQSDIAAARKPKWYVLGTTGAIVGDWTDVEVPADLPARLTVTTRSGGELLTLPAREQHGFYRNLADHLAWGERLAVAADEARRNVAVMEAATESIRRDGAAMKVDI
jgi:scyllo-inositol 2-dehydrogenase (NADP+)